jgi:hypothetical protein
VTSIDTWTYEDRYFSDNKSQWEEWKIEDFLLDDPWYSVVGAPFGIGKTSMSIYLTSLYASKYRGHDDYVPIFVPLKYKLRNIDDKRNNLDTVLSHRK